MVTHSHSRAVRDARALFAAPALALLAACSVPRPEAEAPHARIPPAAPAEPTGASVIPEGARRYEVDPERSELSIRVFRAGPLARLGHDHVITTSRESGSAWLGKEPAGSGFEMRFAGADLVVDDAEARRAAGEAFAAPVPDTAREGTRRNLLGPMVLDAANHPEIVLRADRLEGRWPRPVARVGVTVRGRAADVAVPLLVEHGGDELRASGSLRLRQTDLGLVPFSVAGGAIQVGDELEVEFRVVALATR
ncbi:MAG: YceI family protein [Lysobacterales bacterium]|jgi:hypothetical protein|nr:MAG: YceI family protein [Xanthomonadales bacterium]